MGVITWAWKKPLHPAKSTAGRTTARRRCASTAVTMAPAIIARAIGYTAHAGARRRQIRSKGNIIAITAAGRTPPQTLFMKPPASKAQAGDPRSRADHRPFSFRRLCRSGTGAEDAYRVPERYLTGLPLPNTVSAGKCRNREMCRCYR